MENRKEGIFFINVEKLNLDYLNPRLYDDSLEQSQEYILDWMFRKEDIEELAYSLAINGYFQEEPIIVIPENQSNFEIINNSNANDYNYIVVEGNRRTASVKLLLNNNNKIVDDDFPQIQKDEIRQELQKIPCIIYKNREDIDIYLSIRHIAGNRKWDAFAKAKYIYEKVNENSNKHNTSKAIEIEALSYKIGDKKFVIKKNYIYYLIFLTIESEIINYSSKKIKDRFSLIEVALGSGNTSISKYIGINSFRNINIDDENLIPYNKHEKLENLTGWIFGKDENGNDKLISDSRYINEKLKKILGNDESTEYLENNEDLEGAFELSGGKEEFVIGTIKKVKNSLKQILNDVSKYKDIDKFKENFIDLENTIENIKKLIDYSK